MLGVPRLAGNPVWAAAPHPELVVTCVLLALLLIAGTTAIVWAARRYRRPREEKLTPEEQLARFRALKEQGALSPEEFERIRARLGRGTSVEAPPAPRDPPGPPDAFTAHG